MIKIDNLTKIYKAKMKKTSCALDGVSLTLPDKGLVFILGKSGSGKSTLLNLIGGLDSFDGGDIISFGNSLKGFSDKDYEAYRSDFVSFVFQDYHLIDELTVLENITLFNTEEVDAEVLRDTLDTVGMQEYVDRYPVELSGGQKQRVSIARGIIKNPKVILCDEPTGNLDKNTSYQILELLKKLSEEKLVVIVSHNLAEAEAYGDRIIELADGKIIDDRSRVPGYRDGFYIEEGVATLPYREKMSRENIDILNAGIKNGEVEQINFNDSGFTDSVVEYREEKKELSIRPLLKENVVRLFKKFFFSKYKTAISTIVLSVLMFGLFSIVQSFISFDPNSALLENLDEDCPIVAIEREYTGYPYGIYGDLPTVTGKKAYPLYNQTIWLKNKRKNSYDNVSRMGDTKNMEELYIHENYGLLLCDDEYLLDVFGVNGEVPLIRGDLDDARGSGVLITDYFADSIIYHETAVKGTRYLTYDNIIGVFSPEGQNTACKIVGIIDTDYEEKYKSLFDTYQAEKASGNTNIANIITSDPAYINLADDIVINLGIAYSLNPNFIDSFTLEETTLVKSNGLYFSAGDVEINGKSLDYMTTQITGLSTSDFADGEIAIPYETYNLLFGTEYTSKDANKLDRVEKKAVTVRRYVDNDLTKGVVYEREFTVTAVTASRLVCNENTMLYFKRADWYPSAVYYKGADNVDEIVDITDTTDFRFVARSQRNVQRVNELVYTFRDLFLFLEVTTVAMIVLFLVLFGIRSIKENSYQIGVIKALGGRNNDIQRIFVLKTCIIGVIVAVVASFASIFFVRFANKILIASIETVIGMNTNGLEVIRVIPSLITLDGAMMIVLSLVSALVPVIMLKSIKPVEIIKTKE